MSSEASSSDSPDVVIDEADIAGGLLEAIDKAQQGPVHVDLEGATIEAEDEEAQSLLRTLLACEQAVISNGVLVIDPARPVVIIGDVQLDNVEVEMPDDDEAQWSNNGATLQQALFVVRDHGHLKLQDVKRTENGPCQWNVCGVKVCVHGMLCVLLHACHTCLRMLQCIVLLQWTPLRGVK